MTIKELTQAIEQELLARYGSHLISGEDLRRALGYPSREALRQAIARQIVPIPLFDIDNRRGKFALIHDVAFWLANIRHSVTKPAQEKSP